MKLRQIIAEANVAAKIGKDPKMVKMLGIAMRHDSTLPKSTIAKLGPKPDDQSILQMWSEMLDSSLRNTQYGDLSQDGKFDEWLTRMYVNGIADYEDINGEGGDALGAWKALSTRSRLKEPHQDFNKFKSLKQIQRIVQDPGYREELRRIKDAEVIEKHKRDRKEITIYDDERFLAVVPMNYGSCYTFNNDNGFQASFCTGSSAGHQWFSRYADDGPIISILDKENADDVNGKWQLHAATNQMNNGNQRENGDDKFAERFPGLLKKLLAGMQAKAQEIQDNSGDIVSGGYNVADAIAEYKRKFPLSYASGEEPEAEPEPEVQAPAPEAPAEEPAAQGGTWSVTQIASGRTARIPGDSLEDVQNRVLQRYPGTTLDDYVWNRVDD